MKMKTVWLSILALSPLFFSGAAFSREWKNECVGYYQLQLPDNLEVALYPVGDLVNPRKEPESDGGIQTRRYASPGITFDQTYYRNRAGSSQAQFSAFYYGDYELDISSESSEPVDFSAYKARVQDNIDFGVNMARQYEELNLRMFNEPLTPREEFDRKHTRLIKEYPDAFVTYDYRGYIIYINRGRHLYHFWSSYEADTGDKSQTAASQAQKSEPEVLSLLKRFRARKLYEVPAEQGFCLPYGFIAGDSGQEPRNMAVTWRLKEHPDVAIFFQDLGMKSKSGKEDQLNEKEYVTWLWTWKYHWSAVSKTQIRPEWRSVKMAGRKGVGTFVKSVYKDGSVEYGYVAYVQGDRNARNREPDLLFYVLQDSRLAKDKPVGKDELEKMAERIIASVKRR